MVNLGFEAFEKVKYHGKKYKRLKTCKTEREAELLVESIRSSLKSRRFVPVIQKIRIGLGLGYRYRVWIPIDAKGVYLDG